MCGGCQVYGPSRLPCPLLANWCHNSISTHPVPPAVQVSTRVDIFPEHYIREFTKLQDDVKVFPTTEAREVRLSSHLLGLGLGLELD